MSNKAAIRYAKAVLQNANETGAAQTVLGDMQLVQGTLAASKELRTVLNSPIVKTEDKKQALHTIFKSTTGTAKALIDTLAANRRITLLGRVASSYINLYNKSKGLQLATVTTAVPITEDVEKQVLKKVEELTGSSKVSLKNEVDEGIIGGFILRLGDLQYNASIAQQLSTIKREFSKSL
ncbi:MAG: ATP synthase F1 subunit delta [Marinirhabdus sp.]